MTEFVNLELTSTTYNKILDFLVLGGRHLDNYYEMAELVHLIDYIEDSYHKDSSEKSKKLKRDMKYQEMFSDKELYHYKHFYNVEKILDYFIPDNDISEEDKFYLVCALIDYLKEVKNDIN